MINYDVVPEELRPIFRIAEDIGNHADSEATATFMRIIQTAPDRPTMELAYMIGAIRMHTTVLAVRQAISPELHRLFDAGIEMSKEIVGEHDANR